MSGNIFTIAPHAPFLDTLAERVLDGTLTRGWDMSGPFGLADITIVLPTSRARIALANAFAQKLGGAALLPQIRTFGGAPEEEELFLPPYEADPLPDAIPPLTRKLVLGQLVEAWVTARGKAAMDDPAFSGFANPPSAAEILMLAESLGELIDDCHIQQADIKALAQLDTGDNSAHWQTSLKFLEIALTAWPEYLKAHGAMDAAERRNLQLARQTTTLETVFGDKPVIAAGSTGSIPATADLLKAIADLPRGVLVLPGLDTSLSDPARQHLAEPENAPHGHPQYGLNQLRDRLNIDPATISELSATPHPRTSIMRHALALAEDTNEWATTRAALESEMDAALNNVAIAVARTDEEQARAIALAARQALANNKSVGIISPDRNLARRIVAELKRFDVIVDDSAGTPLLQSRGGRLIRQILALARNPFAPVELVALLRNRAVTLGRRRATITATIDVMERAILRGQRAGPGLNGLLWLADLSAAGKITHAAHRLTEREAIDIKALLTDLEAAMQPLATLFANKKFSIAQFAIAMAAVLARVTSSPTENHVEPDTSLTDVTAWLKTLAAEPSGPSLSSAGLHEALESLMAGQSVRPNRMARQDIAIWGLLEARLQNPDVMILAGLNETVWPQTADPGPWLNRHMRLTMGLEPPERRQGQAAHDFEMAMGNKEVLITRSERMGTSPATASRLLQRMEAFVGVQHTEVMHQRGAVWIARARDLDFAGTPNPVARPSPCPPAHLRPKNLSVTEIESLIRSPYDLYARHVLKLRPLAPLGEDPDLSERGTLVHAILGRFIEEGNDPMAADAQAILMRLAEEEFASLDALPARRILWTARFAKIAEGFLTFEQLRHANIIARHAELSGRMTLEKPAGDFTLRGRADRIDQRNDGLLEVLDFKTGATPEKKEMNSFTAPQLLLEALIARMGGFEKVAAASTASLHYLKLGFGPKAFVEDVFEQVGGMNVNGAVDEIQLRLSRQIDAYLYSDTVPMSAHVFPNPKQRFAGDYDHLARLGEWASIDGGEDGEAS